MSTNWSTQSSIQQRRSIPGFWPKCGLFYSHYDGELSRNWLLAVLLMSLLVITFLPFVIAVALQASCGWLAVVSILNALFACGDLLASGIILFQIPANATIRNQGWKTYWKGRR